MNKDAAAWIRLDVPHGLGGVQPSPEAFTPLQLQAEQLVEHLAARQDEIDRREADLNARTAELEHQLRVARLHQRESEFRPKLAEKWRELRSRLKRREQAMQVAEQRLRNEQAESRRLHLLLLKNLDRRRQALEEQSLQFASVHNSPQAPQISADLQRQLDDVERQRRILADQRRDWEVSLQRAREQARRHQIQQQQRWRCQSAALDQRAAAVDQRRLAAQRLHRNTARLHREILELRLAMEQLWGQLCTQAHPASLVRTLGQLRRRIADHFQWDRQDLQQRRLQLTELARSLRTHQEALQQRQQQLGRWWRQRLDELDNETTRLTDWEAQLRQEQLQLQRLRDDWREEKRRIDADLAHWDSSLASA